MGIATYGTISKKSTYPTHYIFFSKLKSRLINVGGPSEIERYRGYEHLVTPQLY
jgi:hypothetical protein